MTQAVHGVHRVWLVFSGLAFLVCGLLLVARFSRSASPPAATAPSLAPGAVINQQLGVPSESAATGGAANAVRGGKPERTPEAVEPVSPPAHPTGGKKKADKPKDGRGRTSPRTPSASKAGAFPPTTRGLELNDPIAGSESPPPPPPPTRAPVRSPSSPGTSTRPATSDKSLNLGDTKAEHGKPKHHKAPPTAPKEEAEGATDAIPAASSPGSRADKLVEGVLKVNAPTSMLVGESEHIRAVVGTKKNSEAVDKEASADVGDGPRVQLGRDMLLSPLVRMELRADVPGDFDITAFVPQAEQRLTDNETTVWDWAVVPKHEGLRGLTLIVTDLKETSREPIRTKTYPVHIEVRVATITKVHDLAVSVSSVLSGLAGLIGAWMGLLRPVLQRRREGEAGGMGTQRPAVSGAPPHPPGSTGNTLRPEADPPSTSSPPRH